MQIHSVHCGRRRLWKSIRRHHACVLAINPLLVLGATGRRRCDRRGTQLALPRADQVVVRGTQGVRGGRPFEASLRSRSTSRRRRVGKVQQVHGSRTLVLRRLGSLRHISRASPGHVATMASNGSDALRVSEAIFAWGAWHQQRRGSPWPVATTAAAITACVPGLCHHGKRACNAVTLILVLLHLRSEGGIHYLSTKCRGLP